MDGSTSKKIQTNLLQWFKKNHRDLPWRKTIDPYAIWVSEIMLQQTQVKTVIPYYHKFLKAFPTIRSLARADLSKVLKIWEGLGYYSRARNLHRAAKTILNHFNGKIPDNLKDLQRLPGIGRYTAGAILSIAFNQEVPILDGNVKRVLSRLYAISGASQKTKNLLWKYSASLIPDGHASSFNQALMDLGAMICTPKDPLCSKCPIKTVCKAFRLGKPERFPFQAVKKVLPHMEAVAVVIQKDGKALIRQRPLKGFLGGLWEFPNWPIVGRKDLMEYLRLKVKDDIGLKVKWKGPLGNFKQTYSHFRLTLSVFKCEAMEGSRRGKWVYLRNLDQYAMPRIFRQIADRIIRSSPYER